MRKSKLFWPFIRGWLLWALGFTAAFGAVPDGTTEITSLVKIKPASTKVNSNHHTVFVYGKLRLTNLSKHQINGPLGVIIAEVTPDGANLINSNGALLDGTEYVELIPEGEFLSPGEPTAFFSLAFNNPTGKPVKYRAVPYGVLPEVAAAPAAGQIDITGIVNISLAKPKFDQRSKTFQTKLQLTNASTSTISAPVSLALPLILPTGATLRDAAGLLENGIAYVDVPLLNDSLPPKKKTAPLTLRFDNPAHTMMQLEPTVYGTVVTSSESDTIFDAHNVWTQRIDSAAVHPTSVQMLGQLGNSGGWGTNGIHLAKKYLTSISL